MFGKIKAEAKEKMKGHMGEFWLIAIIIGLVTGLLTKLPEFFGADFYEEQEMFGITVQTTNAAGSAWSLVVSVITAVGTLILTYWILSVIRGKKCKLEDAAKYGISHILTVGVVTLVVELLIGIGLVFLIIPGIIIGIGFSQVTPYIADNPEAGIIDAIRESWALMKGHKMEYFLFILSFIGCILLCVLVLPAIYVLPYLSFADTIYYTHLIGEKSPKKSNE